MDRLTRREFAAISAALAGATALGCRARDASSSVEGRSPHGSVEPVDLPKGAAPPALGFPHFPDRLHAYVWRNWQLVPTARLAAVVRTEPAEILRLGYAMGLSAPPSVTDDQRRRSFITVIRRNWHLLPYEQLLALLDWTPERMAFALLHDDFLFAKLGRLKPACAPLTWAPPAADAVRRAGDVARLVRTYFPGGLGGMDEPLFQFVADLSTAPSPAPAPTSSPGPRRFTPCFCYSYFSLYGDPLLEPAADPYPDAYLARLAATGVDGVWLQAVLSTLAPFPWDETLSAHHAERVARLRALVDRARRHGIGVYLYLNEPRSMPLRFFDTRPHMKGIVVGDRAALCTSSPDVQRYLVDAVASVCRAVPGLAGLFTITASENLTNCWYANRKPDCPRCSRRSAAEVIGEVNALIQQGIRKAGAQTQLIAWDWGWADDWAEDIISRLPTGTGFMTVSEWSIRIERGGVPGLVGEYSMSTIGPGQRATALWAKARERGLKTFAKIQAGTSWELSATPYVPVLENVARHAANLRQSGVDGLMLSWTLGGYPSSPNLEVVTEIGRNRDLGPLEALNRVADRRFGTTLGPAVVKTWRAFSEAFREFPFGTGLYFTPTQTGPANLLWEKPTGYKASPVGFPYDDLDSWCAGYPQNYPAKTFTRQFEKIADGFEAALAELKGAADRHPLSPGERRALSQELNVAEAATIHFRSTANQCRFVEVRQALSAATSAEEAEAARQTLRAIIEHELTLARALLAIQTRDSRIGFEASNQYFYVPMDLAEKVLNCTDLLERWLTSHAGTIPVSPAAASSSRRSASGAVSASRRRR